MNSQRTVLLPTAFNAERSGLLPAVPTDPDKIWPPWESLSQDYKDAYGTLNASVYEAAGLIWPAALTFAKKRDSDASAARGALMASIAGTSKVISSGEIIHDLKSYLLKSYKRRLSRETKDSRPGPYRVESLDEATHIKLTDLDIPAQIERTILLKEIVGRMDLDTRRIYEMLILGYTYEEIAKTGHFKSKSMKANALRSRFNKRIKKIAAALNADSYSHNLINYGDI